MSSIVENLAKILSSRYGKDVRQAIHDAIHDCYEDGKAGSVDLIARESISTLETKEASDIATATEAIATKQDSTDNSLETDDKTIVGSINELKSDKQNATDNSLETTSKTIVGSINELNTGKQNATDDSLDTDSKTIVGAVNELKSDIADFGKTVENGNCKEFHIYLIRLYETSVAYGYGDVLMLTTSTVPIRANFILTNWQGIASTFTFTLSYSNGYITLSNVYKNNTSTDTLSIASIIEIV